MYCVEQKKNLFARIFVHAYSADAELAPIFIRLRRRRELFGRRPATALLLQLRSCRPQSIQIVPSATSINVHLFRSSSEYSPLPFCLARNRRAIVICVQTPRYSRDSCPTLPKPPPKYGEQAGELQLHPRPSTFASAFTLYSLCV